MNVVIAARRRASGEAAACVAVRTGRSRVDTVILQRPAIVE